MPEYKDLGLANNEIVSVQKTSGTGLPGSIDTYTITVRDGSTFTFNVTNGNNGVTNINRQKFTNIVTCQTFLAANKDNVACVIYCHENNDELEYETINFHLGYDSGEQSDSIILRYLNTTGTWVTLSSAFTTGEFLYVYYFENSEGGSVVPTSRTIAGLSLESDITENALFDKMNIKGRYATLTALQTANPNHGYCYLVEENNHWYYWNGSQYVSGGLYQSIGIGFKEINTFMLGDDVNNRFDYLYEKYDNSEKITYTSSSTGRRSYFFKKDELYCITITANVADLFQVGTFENNNYVDNIPVIKQSITNYKWIFKATNNASFLYVYNPNNNTSVTIEHLIDKYPEYTSEEIYTISNASHYIPYYFKKGHRYKVVFNNSGTLIQLRTTKGLDTNSIDQSGLYYESFENMEWYFIASDNAYSLLVIRNYTANETIKIYSYDEEQKKSSNPVVLDEFNGILNNNIEATGWTQENDHITRTHSGGSSTWFTDGASLKKYITAYNKILLYDVVIHSGTLPGFYTKSANIETFFDQGWCVHFNFDLEQILVAQKFNGSSLPQTYVSYSIVGLSNYIDKKVRVILRRNDVRGISVSMYDLLTNKKVFEINTPFDSNIVPTYGLGYDEMGICPLQGKLDVYKMQTIIPDATNTFLYIVGDSITEGVRIKPDNTFAYMVASKVPNTIVSGRGGANINGVLAKLETEARLLKPKYIMVTIGTNGDNTLEKLNQVISTIEDIGAIPVINCVPCTSTSIQSEINNLILSLGTKCVRFDIATALNYDLNDGADASLFTDDGVHPNENGYERMFNRVLIDLPEIFNLQ